MSNDRVMTALLALLASLPGVAATTSCDDAAAQRAAADDAAGPFAVVELFTSEGCSSCPTADEVLAGIAADAWNEERQVFALSFHVDYWDRLGWKDPYGDAAHSKRQSRYATAFGANQVYTPQMIVNGTTEFLGSDRERAGAEIDRALEREATSVLTLRPSRSGDRVTIRFELKPVPANAVLNVALVERGLTSKVRRGENGGRTLRHENVVRVFRTQAVDDDGRGTVEISVPAGVQQENASLVAYVQNEESMAVLAATAADLPAAEPAEDATRVK